MCVFLPSAAEVLDNKVLATFRLQSYMRKRTLEKWEGGLGWARLKAYQRPKELCFLYCTVRSRTRTEGLALILLS